MCIYNLQYSLEEKVCMYKFQKAKETYYQRKLEIPKAQSNLDFVKLKIYALQKTIRK